MSTLALHVVGALALVGAVVIAVEVSLSRRMREFRELYQGAIVHARSLDATLTAIHRRDEELSARIDLQAERTDDHETRIRGLERRTSA